MNFFRDKLFWKQVGKLLVKVYLISLTLSLSIFVGTGIYSAGFSAGFSKGQENAQQYYAGLFEDIAKQKNSSIEEPVITPVTAEVTPTQKNVSLIRNVSWGGPDLWLAVNKRRVELGVNPLRTGEELCTIASIRLNELLELGKLDGHEGFSNMSQRRPDLKWIFDKYSVVAEFLAAGASTADETVSLWGNTLGHSKLLTGGEFVWGCIYAQNSFAVAITAY